MWKIYGGGMDMIGTGTIANVLAIVIGGCIGMLAKGGLKAHYQEGILKAVGLAVLFIGASGALVGMLTVENGTLVSAGVGDTLAMVLALALGALAGEFIDLDRRMEQLGAWLKAKADRGGDSQFIQGFVTASLTVCIGAMAIVGSIQDGLTGNAATLYTKSILDFMLVMIFASIYGKGAVFSALPVGVLQGAVTLLAGLVAPVFSDSVIDNLSFLGNMLIFCVGVNLCFGTKFKVANLLPALVLGPVFQWAVGLLPV